MVTEPPVPTMLVIPVAEPTVALAVLALVHTPPGVLLVRVSTAPVHACVGPAIADGIGITVTTIVVGQPVPEDVNVMVEVPAETPLTYPPDVTIVATDGVLLLQVPDPPPESVVVRPTHAVG